MIDVFSLQSGSVVTRTLETLQLVQLVDDMITGKRDSSLSQFLTSTTLANLKQVVVPSDLCEKGPKPDETEDWELSIKSLKNTDLFPEGKVKFRIWQPGEIGEFNSQPVERVARIEHSIFSAYRYFQRSLPPPFPLSPSLSFSLLLSPYLSLSRSRNWRRSLPVSGRVDLPNVKHISLDTIFRSLQRRLKDLTQHSNQPGLGSEERRRGKGASKGEN